MSKKAFSLIELSIVILIVGIIVAGVTQSSRLVTHFKISSARNLTKNSPLHNIRNPIAWYESTLEESFDKTIDPGSSTANRVANWYDVNSQSNYKNNASQSAQSSQPTYVLNGINGIPAVNFNGSSQFLTLPNGTVPYNNSSYTIFFVSSFSSICNCGLLGSGNYGSSNRVNAFRSALGGLLNYWWGNDILTPSNIVSANVGYVITFSYDQTTTNRIIYLNGTQVRIDNPSANQSTSANNTIGTTNTSEYMNGNIGEIIIFDRALASSERGRSNPT